MTLPEGLHGSCDERFAGVAELVAGQLASGEHHGVAFAAYHEGEPVVDIWGGRRTTGDGTEAPWERDTMAVCFSTTKGVMATALHMAMERSGVGYDAPVASVWPSFGRNGKEAITIRQVLCHEAGVPQIRDQVDSVEDIADWDRMVAMIEGLEPIWEPGTANGYHAINFAWLTGELLRRIDGRDVSTFLAEELAGPLELDGLFIGTDEHERVARLITPDPSADPDSAYRMIPEDTIIHRALAPKGDMLGFLNSSVGLSATIPSVNGAFTARSLAKLYSAIERGGEIDGTRILEPGGVEAATTVQNERNDLVIFLAPRWRLGYMSGGPSAIPVLGPSDASFGHVGAGGTLAGADPETGLAYGLVYDLFDQQLLGAARSMSVVQACVTAAQSD